MSHLNGFEILMLFYILHDCINEVSDWIRFFIELHGNSKHPPCFWPVFEPQNAIPVMSPSEDLLF